ncbi:MAG TPA: substrate-binding domain-containing protein [Phycisphaerae bacterium]|nr:substrate-binding domain-containing protein [Phycisphaerae bacterium]
MTNTYTTPDGPRLTGLGKFAIVLFVLALFGGAAYLLMQRTRAVPNGGPAAPNPTAANPTPAPGPAPSGENVQIGVAYGTEKRGWLEQAAKEFAQAPEGKNITVNLIPMGSLEGAQAILKEDKRINAWTPASSLYTATFVADYQLKYNTNPIARQDNLVLTPMVFIMWDERYNAFVSHYKAVSFDTVSQALAEPSGWAAIAGKPEWGVFKFGHTHPNQSSSGLATLVLMAYTYNGKSRDLTVGDIVNPEFQKRMNDTERAVSGLVDSTGTMVREMILKGPSVYDAVFAYESTAIDFLKSAEGRWGKLHVVYPKYNLWNESPYVVLNTPWSSPQQQAAAAAFMNFLLSDAVQKESVAHGFRPANPNVSTKDADSPFIAYQGAGISDDIGTICDSPKPEVITNLLESWQRTQGNR